MAYFYLFENKNKSTKARFQGIKQLETVDEGKIMTIAEQFRKDGFEKGIRDVAIRMLRKNRPLQEIIEDTGLSEAQVKELKKTLH